MENAPWRIGKPILDFLVVLGTLFTEVPRGSGQGAAGTCRANECINGTVCLVPNLGACSFIMCSSIGDVIKLIGPYGVRQSVGVSLCLMIIVFGIFECDRLIRTSIKIFLSL